MLTAGAAHEQATSGDQVIGWKSIPTSMLLQRLPPKLVDDTLKHRPLWEAAGGIFVHHRNVADTLAELADLFPLAEAASVARGSAGA